MGSRIHQLNATFMTAEDRILLRLNTTNKEEFRIWLTRRVMRVLARELGSAERRLLGLENPDNGYVAPGARAIQEFRREASTSDVDFGERFMEGSAGFPFGSEPVLATACEVRLQEGRAAIALALNNKRTLNFMLDVRGLHGTLAMLQKAAARSDWDLGEELKSEIQPPVGPAGLH